MLNFFKLIRYPNLLMIVGVLYLIRVFIVQFLEIPHALDGLHYFLWTLCSVTAAAAGYVINDLYDLEADAINKPGRVLIDRKFSKEQARQIFFGLSLSSLFCGYMVAKAAGMLSLTIVPVLVIALLYFYAVQLKKLAVIGNLLVSLLTALPILLVIVFDLIPIIEIDNQATIRSVATVIAAYALFAFWSNWIREMIKDAEDYRGDKKQGYKTLAVLIGVEQIRYVILMLGLAMLCFTGFYNYYLFSNDILSAIYVLIFVNLPFLYLLILIFKAQNPRDFKKPSGLIKLIMLTAMLSMAVFTLSVNIS